MAARQLPPGWAWAKIAEISLPRTTWNPKASATVDFEYIDIDAVDNDRQRIVSPKRLAVEKAPSRARVGVSKGDILFSLVRPYLKNIAIVPETLEGQVASTAFVAVKPAKGIHPEFAFHQLVQDSFIASVPTYGNSPPAARDDEFFDLEIAIAPTAEQWRISEKLDELLSDLDASVAALERARANLKRYRAAVLKAAVEGKLTAEWRKANPPKEPADKLLERILIERRKKWEEAQLAKYVEQRVEPPKDWKQKYPAPADLNGANLPDLPSGWMWTSTDVVGDVLLGRQRAPQFLTGRNPVRYLRVANIKDDRIDFSDLEAMDFDSDHLQKYRLEPGDILVSEGQSPELLGQSAIFPGYSERLCFQKTLHRFRAFAFATSPEFAQVVFRSHVRSGVFRKLGSITTNIAHLTLEKFRAAPFPLPPLEEQSEILLLVRRLLSIADKSEREASASIARCDRFRQSILKRAFEGKLVPQDPNDEPASVLLERIREQREEEALLKARAASQARGREIASKGGPRMLTKDERDFLRRDKQEAAKFFRALQEKDKRR
jgi:type I restriction enzyme, S subunit